MVGSGISPVIPKDLTGCGCQQIHPFPARSSGAPKLKRVTSCPRGSSGCGGRRRAAVLLSHLVFNPRMTLRYRYMLSSFPFYRWENLSVTEVKKLTQGQIAFRWWSYKLRLDLTSCGPNCSTRYCYIPSATTLVSVIIRSYLCSAKSQEPLFLQSSQQSVNFLRHKSDCITFFINHLAALHCT